MLTGLLPRLIQQANVAVHDCTLAREYRDKRWLQRWWPARCATTRPSSRTWATPAATGAQRQARQITEDHTWVNQQRKMGLITASEMAESEARHVLIRSLGPEMFVAPDTTARSLCIRATCWFSAPTGCTTR